ncbi:BMC domain-containing protein [Carboxydothermus ferrireducens]|uniref:Microcompartment protein CcmL/EutN n=1 Tax=Carboxydothermus ferrireducens DSM 11255 TaxID=1119529 RepID=A0ABX2RF89_9THEO|nr:microcompartment protein CcmL/EutN [Carboxydothermus ferrireducens DSM 11255]
MGSNALGLIETYGLTAAIEAADAALKAAMVSLIGYIKVKSGIVTVAVEGDVAAVKAAVMAGSMAAERVGKVLSVHVIPRPIADIDITLERKKEEGPEIDNSGLPDIKKVEAKDDEVFHQEQGNDLTSAMGISLEELQKMTVHELRRFARKLPGLSIKGREISKANKELLIREILAFNERSENK